MSREVAFEAAFRGDVLTVDLDYFAEHDDGTCGCFCCEAAREIIADGHTGTADLKFVRETDEDLAT